MEDAQFYYECLQVVTSPKQWDTKLGVTHKHDVLSVYCCYFLWSFSITLMFVYLHKLLHCLIIHAYKTNTSFLPCPWNLRSIGPREFKVFGRWIWSQLSAMINFTRIQIEKNFYYDNFLNMWERERERERERAKNNDVSLLNGSNSATDL